ncbi:hypothetical protein D918_04064 [Trichuris suis]|nr:hypothetical protein D918_04064 [Trichuris suis]
MVVATFCTDCLKAFRPKPPIQQRYEHPGRLTADCSNAGITQLPTKMPPGIMILLLDGNDFSRLKRLTFPHDLHSAGLRQLVLRNSRLMQFMAEDLWVLPNLIRLSMANNILKKIPFALRSHVRYSPFHTMASLQAAKQTGGLPLLVRPILCERLDGPERSHRQLRWHGSMRSTFFCIYKSHVEFAVASR